MAPGRGITWTLTARRSPTSRICWSRPAAAGAAMPDRPRGRRGEGRRRCRLAASRLRSAGGACPPAQVRRLEFRPRASWTPASMFCWPRSARWPRRPRLQVTLGRRLPPVRYVNDDVPKRVDYWVATVDRRAGRLRAPPARSTRLPGWPPRRRGEPLSYSARWRDCSPISGPARGRTAPLILVRHASAGSKSDWPKSDMSRPLDGRGTRTRRRWRACCAVSASAAWSARRPSGASPRCGHTPPAPAAWSRSKPAFDVGGSSQDGRSKTRELAAAMARLAADSRPVVVCAHRENLPALLAAAYSALGAASPPGKSSPSEPAGGKPRRSGKPAAGPAAASPRPASRRSASRCAKASSSCCTGRPGSWPQSSDTTPMAT